MVLLLYDHKLVRADCDLCFVFFVLSFLKLRLILQIRVLVKTNKQLSLHYI